VLRSAIRDAIDVERGVVEVSLHIPYTEALFVERFYRFARVSELNHDDAGSHLTGRIAERDLEQFRQFLVSEPALISPLDPKSAGSAPESAA
jgi:hypothetical protein